jgi:hypothetical protein
MSWWCIDIIDIWWLFYCVGLIYNDKCSRIDLKIALTCFHQAGNCSSTNPLLCNWPVWLVFYLMPHASSHLPERWLHGLPEAVGPESLNLSCQTWPSTSITDSGVIDRSAAPVLLQEEALFSIPHKLRCSRRKSMGMPGNQGRSPWGNQVIHGTTFLGGVLDLQEGVVSQLGQQAVPSLTWAYPTSKSRPPSKKRHQPKRKCPKILSHIP